MKISPLNSRVQSKLTFGEDDGPSYDELRRISEENKKAKETDTDGAGVVKQENEDQEHKNKGKAIVLSAGALAAAGIMVAAGLKGCNSQAPAKDINYVPTSYTGILDLIDNYDETIIIPQSNKVDFANPKVLSDYQKQGLTLKNIIKTEYFKGEEGHEANYKKIVSELDQSNPGVLDNIFQIASTGKYARWQDVPFDKLISTNLDEVLDESGLRFSDLNIFSINTPSIYFESHDKGGVDCEACKGLEDTVTYSPINEIVLIDPELKDTTSKKLNTVKDAIVKNYGVEPNSNGYYFLLNMIANHRNNEGLFEDHEGKYNDSNRAQTLEQKGGSFYLYMPKNLTMIIKGGDSDVSEAIIKNGLSEYYSNLVPEVRKVNIQKNNVKTIEDLTKFYRNPITGEALEDVDEYNEINEKYREAIMKTIINSYPEIFKGIDYEDALGVDISNATSIILPDTVINFEAGSCNHTEEEKITPKPKKPSGKAKTPTPDPEPTPTPTPTPDPKPTPTPTPTPDPKPCDPEPEVPSDGGSGNNNPGGGEIAPEPNDPVTKPKAPTTPTTPCEPEPDVDTDSSTIQNRNYLSSAKWSAPAKVAKAPTETVVTEDKDSELTKPDKEVEIAVECNDPPEVETDY